MKKFFAVALAFLCLSLSACGAPDSARADTPPAPADNPAEPENPQPPADPAPPKAAFSLDLLTSFSTADAAVMSAKLSAGDLLVARFSNDPRLPGLEVVSIDRAALTETPLDFQAANPWEDDTDYYYVSHGEISGKQIIQKNKSSGEETVLVSYIDTEMYISSGLTTLSSGFIVYYLSYLGAEPPDHADFMCLDLQSGETYKIDTTSSPIPNGHRIAVSNGFASYINPAPDPSLDYTVKTVRLRDRETVSEITRPGGESALYFYASERYFALSNPLGFFELLDRASGQPAGNLQNLPPNVGQCAVLLERYLAFVDRESDEIVVYDFVEGEIAAAFPPPEDTDTGSWRYEFFYCEETKEALFTREDIVSEKMDFYILRFSESPASSSETKPIPADSDSGASSVSPPPGTDSPQYNPGDDFVSFIESLGYLYGLDQMQPYFVENAHGGYMYFYRLNENGVPGYGILFDRLSGRYSVGGNHNGLRCEIVGTCYSKNAEWDDIVWADPSQVYVVAPEYVKAAMAELLIALGSDDSEFGQDNIDRLSAIVRRCDKYDIAVYLNEVEQFHEGTGDIEAPT